MNEGPRRIHVTFVVATSLWAVVCLAAAGMSLWSAYVPDEVAQARLRVQEAEQVVDVETRSSTAYLSAQSKFDWAGERHAGYSDAEIVQHMHAYGDAILDVLEPKHHAMMRAFSARERAQDAANNRSDKTSDAVGIAGFLNDRERNRNGG